MHRSDCIEEGEVVLLCKNEIFKVVKLYRKRKAVFDRLSFFPDAAIGQPFGTQYEVREHRLVPTVPVNKPVYTPEHTEEDRDNRQIVDDGSSQKLSHEDIHKMKDEGISGKEILESVIHGSSSFKEKTAFSQEKYVKKKEKIHVPKIRILRTSTRLLCQMYYAKGPSKICHLRMDTLAQMLTYSNVHPGCNAVVVETCQGLLLGAVLERLGGIGKVVQVFFGDKPVRSAMDSFGHLTDEQKSIVLSYPLCKLAALVQQLQELKDGVGPLPHSPLKTDKELNDLCQVPDSLQQEPAAKRRKLSDEEDTVEGEAEAEEEEGDKLEDCTDGSCKEDNIEEVPEEDESEERRRKVKEEYEKSAKMLLSTPMDCLLVGTRFHPENIVMSLLPFIAPSRPVVVYSQFQEPLVHLYETLRGSGRMFNLQLSETWLRHYQVLPGRTHPHVNMDAQSGYLLVGTTIKPTN